MGLSRAREIAAQLRALVKEGKDPSLVRRVERVKRSCTFGHVAREFFETYERTRIPRYAATVRLRLEKYLLPALANIPVDEITAPLILEVLTPLVKSEKFGTLKKLRVLIGQIMRYAVAAGKARYDPTPALKGAIPTAKPKHMPAAADERHFASVLKAFWDYPHGISVRNALRVLVYTFQRPGEVVSMKWDQIDWDKAKWRFVLSKTHEEHIVPLSKQVLDILKEQKVLAGLSPFVFPSFNSPKTRPLRVETLNAALKRMGIDTRNEQTSHGFRAVARTLLHEVLGYAPDIIEHQLGHKVPDRLGTAYNRTRFLDQRRKMMQDWADYVDKLIAS